MLKRLVFFPKLIQARSLHLAQSRCYLPIASIQNIKSNHVFNQIKRYESTENYEETQEDQDETVEDAILKNALKFVPEFGFTSDAISQGNLQMILVKKFY